jgi:DNA processing protein
MMHEEQLYTLALTRIPGLGLMGACNLVRTLGSAASVFRHRKELKELIPEVFDKLIQALDCPEAFRRAEEELKYA